ncbi:disulfide bond formation protein DsbD, partial [Vibrio cholerae]|nr:disulfide bond formation protein DsbD [Vibrio cholerae]EGR0452451.1 disulfide bond formation protein DsbD [Vibrio cholerae]EGR4374245.1 disulfide bond formation protein DsbD [Vibrio cholerae]
VVVVEFGVMRCQPLRRALCCPDKFYNLEFENDKKVQFK